MLSQELWHWGCLPAEYRGVIRWEGVVVQRVIGSAEAAVTEESTSETGESMEATVSTETVSDTTASTTGPSYEDEDAWLSWEDYGECSNTVKDFYNDDEKKTYYYEMDEFFFSDEKYAKVNDYLQQMYENYRTQYEEEGRITPERMS